MNKLYFHLSNCFGYCIFVISKASVLGRTRGWALGGGGDVPPNIVARERGSSDEQ